MGDRYESLRNTTFQSFQSVKSDLESLKIRLLLLEAENNRLKEQLVHSQDQNPKKVENENSQEILTEKILKSVEKILKTVVPESVAEALRERNTKAADVFSENSQPEILTKTPEIIETHHAERRDKLKEQLIKTYERNRRSIIKQDILREIKRAQLTKVELRDLAVEQKKYCSKASFYRYLEELELSGEITYRRQGKRTIILPTGELEAALEAQYL